MSLKSFELKQGAIIVSDAHYSERYSEFYDFLLSIKLKRTPCTQLILLGDMFDLLIPQLIFSVKKNKKVIDLINELSKIIEVVYFEGNHDFNLHSLFPSITIFSIPQQPYSLEYENKKIMFLHGDINVGFSYMIFSKFIRNNIFFSFLKIIDFVGFNFISKALNKKLESKENCNDFKNFKSYIFDKYKDISYSKFDYVIEGHYHQNKRFQYDNFEYINLDGFACYQRYISVQSSQEDEIFSDKVFQKET